MEIGWAIDRGLDVLKTSYQIYKAFQDREANAPQQFRHLSGDFAAFHSVFSELLEVLEKYDKPLLVSPTSIQFTLNKCRLFQQKFGVLNEVTTKRTLKQGLAFTFRTLQWSFLAEKLSNDLRAELASHTRILSLYTDTLNLRTSFEERAENYEIREQNREMLRILKGQQEATQEAGRLDKHHVFRHQPLLSARLASPELNRIRQHESQSIDDRSKDQLAKLDAACRDLEALQHLIEAESYAITEAQSFSSDGSNATGGATNFINLARKEIELQYERVSNYQKRMQAILPVSSTSGHTTSNRETIEISPTSVRRMLSFDSSESREQPIRITTSATGLPIRVPIDQASLGALPGQQRDPLSRQVSVLLDDASILLDDASITSRTYLARYAAELEEMDQYDVDGQIAQTREELFDLIQRSFPPSPDFHMPAASPAMSNYSSPSIDGVPSPSMLRVGNSSTEPSTRRGTHATVITRRGSIEGSSWKYLARGVHIDEIPYSCSKCSTIGDTALQVARRASGGLSFRLLCMNSAHRPADGLLFRHDLSSTTPAYPHVYHHAAHQGCENTVQILGSPSRLEACASGRKVALQVQASAGPMYRFASAEDSEVFQQLIHGACLVKWFNVRSVTSSALTEYPSRHVVVRIWSSLSSETLSVSFHASLVDGHGQSTYSEQASSFSAPSSTGNKVKLRRTEHAKSPRLGHIRTGSRDSGTSVNSNESEGGRIAGGLSANSLLKIRWIEIEFAGPTDRDEFVRIWKGGGPAYAVM